MLEVVRGEPTPEELAAVVVVLAGAGRRPGHSPRPRAGVSPWRASALRTRPLPAPGPGGWRAGALPGA